MKILDWIKVARAMGAIGRVATAAEAAPAGLKAPEFAELRAALDELRRALRSR